MLQGSASFYPWLTHGTTPIHTPCAHSVHRLVKIKLCQPFLYHAHHVYGSDPVHTPPPPPAVGAPGLLCNRSFAQHTCTGTSHAKLPGDPHAHSSGAAYAGPHRRGPCRLEPRTLFCLEHCMPFPLELTPVCPELPST